VREKGKGNLMLCVCGSTRIIQDNNEGLTMVSENKATKERKREKEQLKAGESFKTENDKRLGGDTHTERQTHEPFLLNVSRPRLGLGDDWEKHERTRNEATFQPFAGSRRVMVWSWATWLSHPLGPSTRFRLMISCAKVLIALTT
jgi:hypothetical protein